MNNDYGLKQSMRGNPIMEFKAFEYLRHKQVTRWTLISRVSQWDHNRQYLP